jgi:hypothetical protein
MKKFIFVIALFPFLLNAQVTNFSAQQNLFNLSTSHYQLNHPIKPIISQDSTVNFIGFSGGTLTEYIKKNDGTYTVATIPAEGFGQAILAYEDFDKDGLIDILTDDDLLQNKNGSYIQIYFNSSFFLTPKTYSDFDGDGLLDIIAERDVTFEPDDLYFLKNLGNFKFEEILIEKGGSEYETFATGDIDGDGDLDFVATTNKEFHPIRIYFNDGKGNFAMKEKQFLEEDCWTMSVDLFDFDGDNDLEIVLEDSDNGVYIFNNIDNFETFENITDFAMSNVRQPLIVKAFDFNYDNLTDIVVFRQTQNTLYLDYYEAKSQFSFKPAKQIMSFKGGIYIFYYDGSIVTNNMNFVDLNNDGKMDITVTAGYDKKQIAVFNNTIISSSVDASFNQFSLTPNLVYDHLSINFEENAKIQIYDIQGQLVLTETLKEQTVNVSGLNNGVFFIKVLTKEGKPNIAKFIKTN